VVINKPVVFVHDEHKETSLFAAMISHSLYLIEIRRFMQTAQIF